MTKRFLFVITMYAFMLAGCQNERLETPDFTEKRTGMMENLELNKTFVPEEIILVGLGDSLTQGVGDERKLDGYVGRLQEEMKDFRGVLDVELLNLAIRGRRSDQLLDQIQSEKIDDELKKSDFIVMTIGGNDIMRIVKKDLFSLQVEAFQNELVEFKDRYQNIIVEVRKLNPRAPIIMIGLYNPFSVVIDEENEFDQIVVNWNGAINDIVEEDANACFVPVDDLFYSNVNMVYHTDFFHPNSKGYEEMTNRIIETLKTCGLNELTNGEIDF